MLTLYPDQQDDLTALRVAFGEHRRVLFQASTGYGKTVMACAIAHGAANLGTRTCFTVHRKELIRQTCRSFDKAGIPYGVIAPREKAEDEAPDIRRCEQCYAVHEYAPECPYCGYVYPVQEREIKTEAGELKQLTPEEIQALEEHAKRTGKLADWHEVRKAKGYKPGWAFMQFKRGRASANLRRSAV